MFNLKVHQLHLILRTKVFLESKLKLENENDAENSGYNQGNVKRRPLEFKGVTKII